MRGESGQPEAAILHISDTQFGAYHRFNGTDQSLADHLLVDLRGLLNGDVPAIDLIVLSGDIVERGLKSEYEQASAFVDALCAQTGLKHHRVVVVPGNHDVNWSLSESYFAECRAEEVEPRLPYAKKWRHYQQFVCSLHGPAAFTEEQPYRIHRFDDLRVVVAALNSTMRESHRDDDHYGWCGSEQLRWAEAQLRDAGDCVRVGVLHHNARRRPVADNENLRDVDALTDILGPRLDLLLHGHTHDGAQDRLADGTLVLATGSAAVTAQWRPGEVPNQYQILRLRPDRVTRWARQWDASKQKWIADTRISPDGNQWRVDIPIAPAGWQQPKSPARSKSPAQEKSPERLPWDRYEERLDRAGDFLSQVEFVTRRDVGEDCPIERRHKGSPALS